MAITEGREADLRVAPISRKTMQDEVYRQICELILDGGIAPGQQVTIQNLADAFKVSAMPIREALKRLTAAEALTVVSGRTIGIPKLTRKRLVDLKNVRMEIEPVVGRWAAGNVSQMELALLGQQLTELEQANHQSNVKSYVRANHAFHFTIYRASRSEVILPIIESLWLQISPYFHLLHKAGNYKLANKHHGEMLEGLRTGQPDIVDSALRADILGAYDDLSNLLN